MADAKTPAEKVQDAINLMQAKRQSKDYRAETIEYGVWSTECSLEVQKRTAKASAQAAFHKRLAAAQVEAEASEADKLTLRAQQVERAKQAKAVQAEVNPPAEDKPATDSDTALALIESLGIKLTKSQLKAIDAMPKACDQS